jgi:hypothetical protein
MGECLCGLLLKVCRCEVTKRETDIANRQIKILQTYRDMDARRPLYATQGLSVAVAPFKALSPFSLPPPFAFVERPENKKRGVRNGRGFLLRFGDWLGVGLAWLASGLTTDERKQSTPEYPTFRLITP